VNSKMKTIIFWALMLFCVVFLWRTVRQRPYLWTLGFVVPFGILTNRFLGRFSGPRKWTAWIALFSGHFAILALCFAVWNFVIRMPGNDRDLANVAVLCGVGLLCCLISVRSFLSLRKSQIPT